jgi:putative membrane protein
VRPEIVEFRVELSPIRFELQATGYQGRMARSTAKGRSVKDYINLGIKGFCMGAADVVPGVSGGTMAFILGIYRELIESIRSFDPNFLKLLFTLKIKEALRYASWPFLAALGTGILAAIFTLARLLAWLLQNQPILIWSFFFGLILASVFTVSRYQHRWTPALLIWTGLGAIGTYFLVGLVPAETPNTPWFLFASGAVAICAMILPGISGAFILVLLGKYQYVLEAVNRRDIVTLFLVSAGAVLGLACFVRFLHWLLNRYYDITIAILTGLMVGSLRKVWPWKETAEAMAGLQGNALSAYQSNVLPPRWDGEVLLAIVLAAAGVAAVLFLNALSEHKNPRPRGADF